MGGFSGTAGIPGQSSGSWTVVAGALTAWGWTDRRPGFFEWVATKLPIQYETTTRTMLRVARERGGVRAMMPCWASTPLLLPTQPASRSSLLETSQDLAGCPACGVVAVGHGRRVGRLHDTPAHGRPVRLDWANACGCIAGPLHGNQNRKRVVLVWSRFWTASLAGPGAYYSRRALVSSARANSSLSEG